MTNHSGILKYIIARQSPIVEQLELLFSVLEDGPLIQALMGPTRRGPKGYQPDILWRCFIAYYHMGLESVSTLIRLLSDNPLVASACGMESYDEIPSQPTFSRFFSKLAQPQYQHQVEDILHTLTDTLHTTIPGFGDTVAVDSTDLKGWAHLNKPGTDPDARLGAKTKSGKKNFWNGYKLHLTIDAASELPIAIQVTPANAYDGNQLPVLLKSAAERFPWLQPTYVTADKGYDSREIFRWVGEDLGAVPVIDVAKNRVGRGKYGHESTWPKCEAAPVETSNGIRWRCDRQPYDPRCTKFGHCPMLPFFADSPNNQFTILPKQTYYERFSPFAYGSSQWKRIYNQRTSVERVFGRLKGHRKLNMIRVRGLDKVTTHCLMSVLTMQAQAVATGSRALVRKVA